MRSFPFVQIVNKRQPVKVFVNFWNAMHPGYAKNDLYLLTIHKKSFKQADIEKLFEWKNGMEINGHPQKTATLGRILENLSTINQLKHDFQLERFEKIFGKIRPIWQIFLLHIINPARFPIFDQHVYRACCYLQNGTINDLITSPADNLEFYHETYCPFFDDLRRGGVKPRELDQALWAFGKFLKTRYASGLVSSLS